MILSVDTRETLNQIKILFEVPCAFKKGQAKQSIVICCYKVYSINCIRVRIKSSIKKLFTEIVIELVYTQKLVTKMLDREQMS